MVQIAQPAVDPFFGNLSPIGYLHPLGPSPEAYRYWVKFFSHHSQFAPSVLIPNSWINFFSFLLLQSPTFDWTKDFLQSNAWSFIELKCQVMPPFSLFPKTTQCCPSYMFKL